MRVFVALDVGKTNLRVAVFDEELRPLERWSVATANVPEALEATRQQLRKVQQAYDVARAGVSIFGPLQKAPAAADYGALIESSEPAWSNVNVPALVAKMLGVPVHFDFDVNAGALAEAKAGAGVGLRSSVYLSVGTGVGGTYVQGVPSPGHAPQLGHMSIPREADDLMFEGTCRFHGTCLQGLASGKAIAQRWGVPGDELLPDHPAWDLEARYLARACANLVYTFAPERIVLGSSIALVEGLTAKVNHYLSGMLNDFLEPELRVLYDAEAPVVQAALTPDSSLLGAAMLARGRGGLCLTDEGVGA